MVGSCSHTETNGWVRDQRRIQGREQSGAFPHPIYFEEKNGKQENGQNGLNVTYFTNFGLVTLGGEGVNKIMVEVD